MDMSLTAGPVANPATLPNARKFLIFGVMAFGQFMALLDIQIVSASLNDVHSGLSPHSLDWRWIFFINVAPGIAVTALTVLLIRVDRANLAMFRRIDWVHLAAMALFLAALEYVLEEGPRLDWFSDPRIMIAAWL